MKSLVIDASVVIKWLLPGQEDNAEKAIDILCRIKEGEFNVVQPVHWLAEVSAVLVRLSPESAQADIADLCAMHFTSPDNPELYLRAADISAKLSHHLFDTLYHAAALYTPDAVLVTDDRKYYQKAKSLGRIILLQQWEAKNGGRP